LLVLEYVEYRKQGCDNEADEQTDVRPEIEFLPAALDVASVTMDASEKVVGVSGAVTVSGASNEVTITFKPTTMLDAKEGSIKVYS